MMPTGEEQMQTYSAALSNLLQWAMGRYDLDTAKTEALTQWASMVTESPTPSSYQGMRTLMSGLKDSETISNDPESLKIAIEVALMAHESVRYATVVKRPGKPTQVIAYMGR